MKKGIDKRNTDVVMYTNNTTSHYIHITCRFISFVQLSLGWPKDSIFRICEFEYNSDKRAVRLRFSLLNNLI
jgi:hypothetical protein